MPFQSAKLEPTAEDVDVMTWGPADNFVLGMSTTFSFFIPGPPLSVDKLRDALDVAIREKIPQAGAREVVRDGIHEFHIPKNFSDTVKPFGFRSASHDGPFPREKYSFPPTVPTNLASRPCTLPLAHDFFPLFRAEGAPLEPAEFLVPGTPALQVFVSTYADATLIGLSAPHALFDIHGVATLCRAWTAAVNGQLDSIVASPRNFAPYEDMANAEKASGRPERFEWGGWYFLSAFWKVIWIFWFIVRLVSEGKEVGKWVWIPKEWLANEKETCMAELKERGSDEWVGSNDVLAAAVFKAMYHGRTDNTQVSLHNAVNLRRPLPDVFNYPYLHNAIGHCVAPPISASKLGSQSVLETALLLRRRLNAYTADTELLKAQQGWVSRKYRGKRPPVIPSPVGAEYAIITNWRSAKLGELDFHGARSTSEGPVNPSVVFAAVPESFKVPVRGGMAVVCESDEGVWITMGLGERVWERVRASGMFGFV